MSPVGGTNFVFRSVGNLIPVTEMKNVQKAPKIPVEPRSVLSVTSLGCYPSNLVKMKERKFGLPSEIDVMLF